MAIYLRCQSCKSDTRNVHIKVCGKCGSSIPKNGRKYRVVVTSNGKTASRMVDNLSIAKDVEAKIKGDLVRGDFSILKKRTPTLDEVWEKYLPWAQQNKKTWEQDQMVYSRHLKPLFGNKPLDKISPFDIESFRSKLKKSENRVGKPYTPASINRYCQLLSGLFTKAFQWNLYDGENPYRKVNKLKENNTRIKFFSGDELDRLHEVLNVWPDRMTASFIYFALYTGVRRGEIFKLKWQDIDLSDPSKPTMILRDPKCGIDQALPLSENALETLQSVPTDIKSDFIFYGRDGKQRKDFRRPWHRVRKAAGLDDFHFHDIRHHFASQLVSNGMDILTVSQLLTHKDVRTTQRYAHVNNSALRDAVNLSDDLNKNVSSATSKKMVNIR